MDQAINLVNPIVGDDASNYIFDTYGSDDEASGIVKVSWNSRDIIFSRNQYEITDYKILSLKNDRSSSITYSIEVDKPDICLVEGNNATGTLNSGSSIDLKATIKRPTQMVGGDGENVYNNSSGDNSVQTINAPVSGNVINGISPEQLEMILDNVLRRIGINSNVQNMGSETKTDLVSTTPQPENKVEATSNQETQPEPIDESKDDYTWEDRFKVTIKSNEQVIGSQVIRAVYNLESQPPEQPTVIEQQANCDTVNRSINSAIGRFNNSSDFAEKK